MYRPRYRHYVASMTISLKHFDNMFGQGWTRRPDVMYEHIAGAYQYNDGTWMITYLNGESKQLGDANNRYEFNFVNLDEEEDD